MDANDEKNALHKGKSVKKIQKIVNNKGIYFAGLEKSELVNHAKELFSENYDLKEHKRQLEQKVSDLEFQLKKIELTKTKEIDAQKRIDDLPLILFIKEIVRLHKKVVTSKAVSQKLIELKPALSQQWNDLPKRVSDYLSRLVTTNELKKYRSSGWSGYYYGLPEWFDERGVIKRHFGL